MMIWELLLVVAVGGMVVLIVRRLPAALKTTASSEPESEILKDRHSRQQAKLASQPENRNHLDQEPVGQEVSEPVGLKSPEPAASLSVQDLIISAEAGEAAFRAKKFPEAASIYEQLLESEPSDPKLYNRLGAIYLEMEQFHEARDTFRSALKFGDQVASRHANLALAEYALGHRLTAVRHMKRAVALAPNSKKYLDLLETIESERS